MHKEGVEEHTNMLGFCISVDYILFMYVTIVILVT